MASETPLRVMIVDDDLRIHAALGMVLGSGQIEHVSALPQQLEERLASFQPTVILLDLSMPTLDGIAALGVLRTHQYAGRIVVMSGSGSDLIESARRVGQSYGLRMGVGLQKPFRAAEIFAAVRDQEAATPSTDAESDIARAFALSEFCFHYQPKFELGTRALVGFESLARWQHPTRGLQQPGSFLPLVANSGKNGELAQLALKDAVKRLEEWHQAGLATHLSINVALNDATDPAFLLQLTGLVQGMSAPASSLIVELLEAPVAIDLNAAAAALTRVRLMGVGISIDDFGTQSSSLARLQHLPANELKIDRSFVANLLKFRRDQVLVRSVIGMARDLGMTSVAEGIEDQETATLLLEMGCAVGQGFFFAKPMTPADATDLLRQSGERVRVGRTG